MSKRLLLISNSTLHGSGYLDHCALEIGGFLGKSIDTVLFVPFARPSGITNDQYAAKVKERFGRMGYDVVSVHKARDPKKVVQRTEAIFIGGGNTFTLLSALYGTGILREIRARVNSGVPYVGTSAGANVACPTMMNTNDMPITYVPSFRALNLVPFQINPHFLDHDPRSTHMGEPRETRLNEYHVYNDHVVVGMREGAILHVDGNHLMLKGSTGVRIFEKGREPVEHAPGKYLDFLLQGK